MASAAAAAPAGVFSRVWQSYLRVLNTHPLRTKMITSGTLFLFGDTIAQFGIEGRKLGVEKEHEGEAPTRYEPGRALRMSLYGGVIFAPLAHTWLSLLDRVRFPSKMKTLAVRLVMDQCMWGPFIVSMFWASNGIMEGRTPEQVKAKVQLAFIPSYIKSVCVFAPTQIVNFAIVPLHHRLAVQQTVGLGWNIFLSYQQNINNKRLAKAEAALAVAQSHEYQELLDAPELPPPSHAEVERAQAAVEKAKARKDKIQDSQGGGSTGVGTRMGW